LAIEAAIRKFRTVDFTVVLSYPEIPDNSKQKSSWPKDAEKVSLSLTNEKTNPCVFFRMIKVVLYAMGRVVQSLHHKICVVKMGINPK
jgi:hypothetical protein